MFDLLHRSIAVVAAGLIAGCATVKAPELSRDHPANPNAAETPAPQRSSALIDYRKPGAATVEDGSSGADDMGGMDHSRHAGAIKDGKNTPDMDHQQHQRVAAGADQHEHGADHEHKASRAGHPGKPANVTREIKVIALDTMRYEPAVAQVGRGETVRFVVMNAGKLGHEFVIGDATEQQVHAEMMRKMPNMKHEDDNMLSLEPGETKNLVWQFADGGELEIACHVPGHYEAGMRAKVTVAKTAAAPAKDQAPGADGHDEHKH
jgi:uncharacterized cupredoxin-like copper-binding protein